MNRLIVKSRVGADGVLRVTVPVGPGDANCEVEVTIEPVAEITARKDDWQSFISSTAGAWRGDFQRPEQGEYEQRDSFP